LIEGAIEVYPTAAGETAAHLPWLWPDAASLVAFTEPLSPITWPIIRRDPAALLLLFGHGSDAGDSPPCPILSRSAACSYGLRTALIQVEKGGGEWIDWRRPELLSVYRSALTTAHLAHLVAGLSHRCDPDTAWVGGLLAPLGWFAVGAVDPDAVGLCLGDQRFAADPLGTQQAIWGLDHAEIARRLARRWMLPDWLRITIGHLGLRVAAAAELGAEPNLFAAVQLAALLAERDEADLGLTAGIDRAAALQQLGLSGDQVYALHDFCRALDLTPELAVEREDPRLVPALTDRLRGAIEEGRQRGPINQALERDVDRLHALLVEERAAEEERIKAAKLAALAEFAAGASHEINNPLAVISGQSQYLLNSEADEERQQALQSIMRQVQRINAILTDLMQFARPGRAARHPLCLRQVVHAVTDELRSLAEERGVELRSEEVELSARALGDARQLQSALAALVRNGLEAATPDGWVRIRAERSRADHIDLVVEDSGPGPDPIQCQHMFDPFYSGRTAGRGRGLGLPTAWRLAREHGGDVRFVGLPDGPTRFVLSLPVISGGAQPDRLSA
jgi:two-component system, NtrC family, sensor kinase